MNVKILAGGLLLCVLQQAHALDITVTRFDDPAPGPCLPTDCSLREAVLLANTNPGADTIHLAAGAYQLTIPGANEDQAMTGDLDVTDDLTILGAGQNQTSIVMTAQLDRVLDLLDNPNTGVIRRLTISDLSISGGNATQTGSTNGGCVQAYGTLQLTNVTIGNCTATGNGGGLLYSGNSLALTNVVIQNGTASVGGGAYLLTVANPAGMAIHGLTVSGSIATGEAGGLFVYFGGGASTMDHVTLENNNAGAGKCGGSEFGIQGQSQLSDFTLSNNIALTGGGLCLFGISRDLSADLWNFTVTGNQASADGGGLLIWPAVGGTQLDYALRMHAATISGNAANLGKAGSGGGGIAFVCDGCDNTSHANSLQILDSSITGNSAAGTAPQGRGGGLYSELPVAIARTTFANNTADYFGGAIALAPATPGQTTSVDSSTFDSNLTNNTDATAGGGGIALLASNGGDGSIVSVRNSTFFANASLAGGALYDDSGVLGVSQSTIYQATNNPAGSIGKAVRALVSQSGSVGVSLENTFLFGDCAAASITAAVGNMDANGIVNSCNLTGTSQRIPTQQMKLGALADNGGPTRTMLPQSGSALIGNGDASACASIDQRGYARTNPAVCDVGAVQSGAIDDVIFRDGFETD